MSTQNSTCNHCGKPLQNQICFACGGKGYITELALVRRECTFCNGTGKVWRCEDEFKHIVEDSKRSHTVELDKVEKHITQARAKDPAEPADWEPPTWRPIHPENPWNIDDPAIRTILPKTTSPKHRPNRNSIKKGM